MRLLITGAGGLLGLNLALRSMRDQVVTGVDRGTLHHAPFQLLQRDLTETGAFEQSLRDSRAEAVIHCAALADVDACERDPVEARRVNTVLPAHIAKTCHRSSLPLIHISTDAVFDGAASGTYSEDDHPNPTSIYAQTKLDAEAEVLSAHPLALVTRVNFYGWSSTGRRSLAEFFVNKLSVGSRVRGFTDVAFCPMMVSDLGEVLLRMLELNLRGIYHAVGAEPMSKYEFGIAIAREFGFDASLIAPVSVEGAGLAARRAHNLALSIHKLSTAIPGPMPRFSTGLAAFHRQFKEGYPQQLRSYQQLSTENVTGQLASDASA